MQTKDIVCLQCQKAILPPLNRLVHDACGHAKCRSCLLDDVENCKQCLLPFKPSVTSNNTPDVATTDNHTAVIHCNGKARFNSESVPINVLKKAPNNAFGNKKSLEKTSSRKKAIHIPSHITVKPDPPCYLCTICGKTFATKSHVKYHKYCTGELKPYKCELCSQEFILTVQYQAHMYKHSNLKPFKCTECQKSFSEKSKLTRHLMLHSAGRSFVCSDCGKSFKTKDSLRIHSLIHKKEKAFSCKFCLAKFNNSSNLKKHLVSHSTEKVHMCDQCGRRFKLKWALTVHRQSHLNIRPHICAVCSKSFVYPKDLQRHVLIHTETKEFTCGICLTSFRRNDNLLRHMKNSHPGKKGDVIKNTMKVSELPKKSVVIDNPNAVNVITASPAIKKCKADSVAVPVQQPTAISTDSRPTGSVINGPIKLAFKTPAFKSNYNIKRGGEFLPSAQIAKSVSLTEPVESDQPLSSASQFVNTQDTRQNIILPSYSSVVHYETSFQNRKHALIKNIKFKVPEEYTSSFKTFTTSNPEQSNKSGKIPIQAHSAVNRSVIVNNSNPANSSDIHWRRRTSQNLVLKS